MKQMKQMKQMQQESRCTLAGLSDDEALKMMHPYMMQQESRCTLAGLSDDEALKMMQQMQMMQPCTLQRASKGFKGCKPIRCTIEERKALEGLEVVQILQY
jgi:uncharacterized protein YjiS (DUF1127 family)